MVVDWVTLDKDIRIDIRRGSQLGLWPETFKRELLSDPTPDIIKSACGLACFRMVTEYWHRQDERNHYEGYVELIDKIGWAGIGNPEDTLVLNYGVEYQALAKLAQKLDYDFSFKTGEGLGTEQKIALLVRWLSRSIPVALFVGPVDKNRQIGKVHKFVDEEWLCVRGEHIVVIHGCKADLSHFDVADPLHYERWFYTLRDLLSAACITAKVDEKGWEDYEPIELLNMEFLAIYPKGYLDD